MCGAFEISAINNAEISALPSKYRALDGLFQAFGMFFFFQNMTCGVKLIEIKLCVVVASLWWLSIDYRRDCLCYTVRALILQYGSHTLLRDLVPGFMMVRTHM